MTLRTALLPLCLGFALVAAAPLAHAANDQTGEGGNAGQSAAPHGGTLKGAAIGGLAGHEMGGHTKTGAAVGAAVGHHQKAKAKKAQNPG